MIEIIEFLIGDNNLRVLSRTGQLVEVSLLEDKIRIYGGRRFETYLIYMMLLILNWPPIKFFLQLPHGK